MSMKLVVIEAHPSGVQERRPVTDACAHVRASDFGVRTYAEPGQDGRGGWGTRAWMLP